MKKVVNGKIVEIPNIDLFILAAEGLAIENFTANRVSSKVGINSKEMNRIIECYEVLVKSIPYPLYAVDIELKYVIIGKMIKKMIDRDNKNTNKIWVDTGLWISLENENKAIKFINTTWSIENITEDKLGDIVDIDDINLENYSNTVGYEEFTWFKEVVENRKNANFYNKFLPQFIKACNYDESILKWELMNILNFGNVPNELELPINTIIDMDKNRELTLDIYFDCEVDTEEKETVLSYCNGKTEFKGINHKKMKIYQYDVYEKYLDSENSKKTKVRTKPEGTVSLFQTLTSIKEANGDEKFSTFSGIACDNNLIYCIDNRVLVTKLYKYVEPVEVARGVSLYGYSKGIIYIKKVVRIFKGVMKELIYSYSIKKDEIRLCKIQFKSD